MKASEDMRAPMAFLLGKLDFMKDFRDFDVKPQGTNYLVVAHAKNDKLPYEEVQMLVTPEYAIQRLVIQGQDQSILTFQFAAEKLNPPVDDSEFKFQMPAGATLVGPDGGPVMAEYVLKYADPAGRDPSSGRRRRLPRRICASASRSKVS